MAQSMARVFLHLVFSTKGRVTGLHDSFREPLHGYISGTLQGMQCPPVLINSVEDHVHMLFELSRSVSISKVVSEVKTSSNKWIKVNAKLPGFEWQSGYGVFSVSKSQVQAVRDYIAGQREHHRHVSFQEEMRNFFKKHGVDIDERYIWD